MTTTVSQQEQDLMGGLVNAVLGDGFGGIVCGDRNDPHAMILYFDWPDHIDVITVPRRGHTAAARLVKPAGGIALDETQPNPFILDPPDNAAVWSFAGDLHLAVEAALGLPHPDFADSPRQQVPVPAELRVPREWQRPMHIRPAHPERRDARAARLNGLGPRVVNSEKYFNNLLMRVDEQNAMGFASNFTPDGEFKWANFPTVTGRTAIAAWVQDFFPLIRSVDHCIFQYRQFDDSAITRGEVTFTTLDGEVVTVPFMTESRFSPDDATLMEWYQVFLDPSPLVGVTVPA